MPSFQRKEYANIEIVLTEKKGYGLRAEDDLPKYVLSYSPPCALLTRLRDTFIYEYVGDVVNPISFKKRMREYGQEGIRHFYFMMLQKDEVGTLSVYTSIASHWTVEVHRCDKEWWDRSIRKS